MGTRLKVMLAFEEPLLGTAPGNPELYRDFVAANRPEGADPEEAADLPPLDEEVRRATTVFHRTAGGTPCLYDYQIKGFLKDACSMLARVPESASSGVRAYKKIIDGLIFVSPRKIPIVLPDGQGLDFCERPLRAQTPQGERVALARSERAPAGSRVEFEVNLLAAETAGGKTKGEKIDLVELVEELLAYGHFRGLGQWRGSGMGRFVAEWSPEV